jgi:hypothetical protein
MEKLGKTTENLSQDSRSADWDVNSGPPKYEAEVLTIKLWRSL